MSSSDELAAIESDLGGTLKSARRIKNDQQAYAILANLVAVTSRINGAISSEASPSRVGAVSDAGPVGSDCEPARLDSEGQVRLGGRCDLSEGRKLHGWCKRPPGAVRADHFQRVDRLTVMRNKKRDGVGEI